MHLSCSNSSEVGPQLSGGICVSDKECPAGEECTGDGCNPTPPTLYPHIQLASVCFYDITDPAEIEWRATHNDLLAGAVASDVNELRSYNPNLRVYESYSLRYHRYEWWSTEWAVENGYDPEDFYLHYREDVLIEGSTSIILVEGFPPGMVPGWNPQRQADDPPASATERWQSRAIGTFGNRGEPWFLANISDAGYRNFLNYYTTGLIDGSILGFTYNDGLLDGVLTDAVLYYPAFNIGQIDKTNEFYGIPLDESHPYALDFVSYLKEAELYLASSLEPGKQLIPNYSHVYWLNHSWECPQDLQKELAWVWAEVWLNYRPYENPISGSNRVITYERDYKNAILQIARKTRDGMRIILGALDWGGSIEGSERGKLMTLALCYIVQNRNTYYGYRAVAGDSDQIPLSSWQWNAAVQFDIGRPASIPDGYVDFEGNTGSKNFYEFASGPDPYDSTLTYHILARNYTNALVLAKMLPGGSVVDERSITTHPLDRPYAVLNANGELGVVVTEASIKNNEGLILIPVE